MTEENENLVAYRLKQVEDGVKEVNVKLDRHMIIEATVQQHTYQIDALLTTRNRLIAWLSTVSVAAVAALIGTLVR